MYQSGLIRRAADAVAALSARRAATPGRARIHAPGTVGVFLQWGIGDAVLATPLLAALRAAWPRTRIDALGKPWLADLFAGESFVDRCLPLVPPWTRYSGKYRLWERDWRIFAGQLGQLRGAPYDLLVSLRWDAREILQTRLLRARDVAAFAAAGSSRWVTIDYGLSAAAYGGMHRSAAAAHAAGVLTGLAVSPNPWLKVPDAARQEAAESIRRAGHRGGPILAVHAGAGTAVRAWPAANFAAVLERARERIGCLVLIDDGAPVPAAPPDLPVLRWRGALAGLKAVLSRCDVLLCSDAGPMHVAAAVGCRAVAIFGPTAPGWFAPVGPRHEVAIAEPMPCRPCHDRCIYSTPVCMERVDVEAVAAQLDAALVSTPPAAARATASHAG